jgi:cation/acetate symporter
VAQYIIIASAFVVPVVWLAIKQTGVPIPQGYTDSSCRR